MQISDDVTSHLDFCIEMECAAAEAYLRFVYDDWETAVAVQRLLGEKGLLECSPPYGRVLLRDGEPMGMVAGLPGEALRKLRMRAAFALRKHPTLRPDEAIQRRIKLAHRVLVAPEDTDYYSSKLGVSPRARGLGAGPLLMHHVTGEAKRLGFRRIIGEVAPENRTMLHVMCDKVGWERLGEHRVEDPETGRSLAYVHVAMTFA